MLVVQPSRVIVPIRASWRGCPTPRWPYDSDHGWQPVTGSAAGLNLERHQKDPQPATTEGAVSRRAGKAPSWPAMPF